MQEVRIGAVGMLALLTAPLGWGLFLYHMYLIWAGMTTNESSKWEDWKDAVHDGLVFRREKPAALSTGIVTDQEIEPIVQWPAFSDQQLTTCEEGSPLDGHEMDGGTLGKATAASLNMRRSRWEKVHSMQEVENLYDLGFWDNLRDVLPSA